MQSPSLAALTWLYLRIGNLTFGGGDPTMLALQRELVDKRGWLTADQYGMTYSMARVTPGTNVLAFCAGSGWLIRGWLGALLTVAAVGAPCSFLVVWLISRYDPATNPHWVRQVFTAIAASATGMMAAGSYRLIRPNLRARRMVHGLLLVGGAFTAARFGITPIPILAAAVVIGLLSKDA